MRPLGVERVGFLGVLVRRQVAVTQRAEGEALPGRRVNGSDARGGGLAVVLDEGDDVHARRQLDEPLFEAHEEVLDLGRFGAGFVLAYLTDGKSVTVAVVAELAVPVPALSL